MGKGFHTLACSPQVLRHDRDPDFSGRSFNPNQFSRHNLRVRFGVES